MSAPLAAQHQGIYTNLKPNAKICHSLQITVMHWQLKKSVAVQQTTMSSYSYSSSTYSSTSTTRNGQRTGQAYQQQTSSDPSGTAMHMTAQQLGQPAVQESRYYDAEGRQILEDGRVLGQSAQSAGSEQRRIEDVSEEPQRGVEKEREYEERMEDEYAKREGGA
jgi:hypothetical protein